MERTTADVLWPIEGVSPARRLGVNLDGGLKDMMAKATMLALHRDGLVVLPPPK